ACEVAAVLTGCTDSQRQALTRYGMAVGTAFQLVDDALDYEGDAEALGKNVGDDLAEGKPTLPLIYAMTQCSQSERTLIENAVKNGDASYLADIVDIVHRTGASRYTLAAAEEAVVRAEA